MKHAQFMQEAIRLSRIHMIKGAGGPFGAVIVKKGRIIGRGWNQVTSSNDPTAHAEVMAIRDACKKMNDFDLAGAVIYTSCEPCPMCLAALYWARISKIYYGNNRKDAAKIQFDDEFLYKELAKPLSRRLVPLQQIQRKQALQVFKIWNSKQDKLTY